MEACDLLVDLKWCDWAWCLRKRRNQFGFNLWVRMMMRRHGIELQENLRSIGSIIRRLWNGKWVLKSYDYGLKLKK